MKTKRSTIALALAAALALPLSTPLMAADESPASAAEQAGRGYLGISIERIPPSLRAQLPTTVPRDQGVMVEQVMPGSPADQAGLRPYDILLSYNDQKLFSPEQLSKLVATDDGKQPVTLEVVREGRIQSLQVTLGRKQRPLEAARGMPWHGHHRHPHPMPMPSRPLEKNAKVWESFAALSLRKLDDGRYQAAIEYLATDGSKKRLEFEGSREELRKQIMSQKDLPDVERQQLLEVITSRDNGFLIPPMPDFDEDFMMPPPPRWFGWGPDF